jgi:hypothetical protein
MTRQVAFRLVLGIMLLALAAGALTLARGTADAAALFKQGQADWQRGVVPAAPPSPGPAQRAGEELLGIAARADALRAYATYRAGLADVIPGTTYPQARAQFDAIKRLSQLRPSLGRADRATVDTALGVVLAAGAAYAGQQREGELAKALAAFRQAAHENPDDETAKLDLEVLLRATAQRPKTQARATGSPNKRKQGNNTPRSSPAVRRTPGTGF